MKRTLFPVFLLMIVSAAAFGDNSTMPDGTQFPVWEKPMQFTRTYYVDGQAKSADDKGPGTKEHPFKTINHAAQVLQPGERVVIAEGVYREEIRPARGGNGPEAMISYEAAPGAKVVVKGSEVVTGWQPSEGWNFGIDAETHKPVKAWELKLTPEMFPDGYNPFEVDNVLGDKTWLRYAQDNMITYFRRRGLVFVDGHPLEPVETARELAGPSPRSMNYFTKVLWTPLFKEFQPEAGKVWIEMNGLTLHIRLANDDDPAKHTIEITTREQVFAPAKRYQAYIRVKGISFEQAGNGFPVPQRGMVSANRGNHFISKTTPSSGPTASVSTSVMRTGRRHGLRSRWATISCGTMYSAIAALRDWAGQAAHRTPWWRRTSSSGSAGRTRP